MPKASASLPRRSSAKTPIANRRKQKAIAICVCTVLLIAFYFIAWTASWDKSPTSDEPLHLVGAWTQTHIGDFRCNPEDPPLWKYWAVAGTRFEDLKLTPQYPFWNGMLREMDSQGGYVSVMLFLTHSDATALITAARARMAVLGVVLGMVIGWWAWRLAGPVAATVAVAAMCLDPNFLAHTPLVKNDIAMTLGFLAFMAVTWLLGEKVTIRRWIILSLLLGAALSTKFSGILTIPMLGIALLCRTLMSRPWPVLNWTITTRLGRLGVSAALAISASIIAYIIIWACYDFRFGPSPDPTQLFDQKMVVNRMTSLEAVNAHGAPELLRTDDVDRWTRDWKLSTVDKLYIWADDHRVLPEAWLRGFYYTYARGLTRASFLCGEYARQGWWYYFFAAMLFKTPLTTLIALSLALGIWAWKTIRSPKKPSKPSRDLWPFYVALIAPIFYMATASAQHLNLGLRHVLPVYPFLFIFLGVIAGRAWQAWPKIVTPALAVLAIALATETLCAYPDFIPFFSVAFGGARGGLHLLGDSNLDWGQDVPDLVAWQHKHPDRQMYLNYFGAADPRYYGLHYLNVEGSWAPNDQLAPGPLSPVLAVSATDLQAIYTLPDLRAYYAQFMHEKPLAVLGGSIYIFDRLEDHLPNLRKARPMKITPAPATNPAQ